MKLRLLQMLTQKTIPNIQNLVRRHNSLPTDQHTLVNISLLVFVQRGHLDKDFP